MNEARDEILAGTRAAIRGGTPPDPVARAYRTTGVLDDPGRVMLLAERLLDYRARVEHTTASALRDLLEEIARGDRRTRSKTTA